MTRAGRLYGSLAVAVIVIAAAVGLHARATSQRWEAMEAQLAGYVVPPAFGRVGELEREGDWRCSPSCTARLSMVLSTDETVPQACHALEGSLREWSDVTSARSEPSVAGDGGCFYVAAFGSAGAGREVQASVDPTHGALRVVITAVGKCVLAC